MAKTSTTKPTGVLSALAYLEKPEKYPVVGVCALVGNEAYLKHEALMALRLQVLSQDDGEFAFSTMNGGETQFAEVLDALASISLFGGGNRVVVVEEADSFVSEYRERLESYVDHPAKGSVLVLDVKTWPGNTRLAKAVAVRGLTIECKSPDERVAKRWLVQRAKSIHGVQLDASAVDAICELLPPELGILIQEVARLALLVGDERKIDAQLVRDHVGGWRARTAWNMIDAAADGRARDALEQLERLIAAGEKPHGLLPQMSSSLRKFATAARLIREAEADRRRLPLSEALKEAGVPPFRLKEAERQLRQIGRDRALQLTEWLLAADLKMKGHNSSDARARLELEQLIVRLSPSASENPRPGPAVVRRQ